MDALTKGNQPSSFRKMLSCFSFKHNEKGKQLTCSGTGYPVSISLHFAVVSACSAVLVGLYEEPEKPRDALEYP